ncbi:iron-siderophore ABC transporter substrate-binding protein [Tianweitania populi]|uniref:iron-siderophore ABC transporter substrate-binding protein n=1 Tax=Tianweitania populi TaxID=1607949 RepID=UPI001AED133B|nr:iron-siderophore ABC transporter substrate-binding protein [Tianweitania populi]
MKNVSPLKVTRRAVLGGMAACAVVRPAFAQDEIRFTHAFGETVLKAPAKRVVSLGYTTHDTLLALDVVPVATRYWFGDQPFGVWPWAKSKLGDAQPTLISGEVSMETVASLQPDLIVGIGSGISQAEYSVLSQIAPTLMQAPDQPAYGTPWNELTLTLGRAVGKETLANGLIAETQNTFALSRARHPDWAGKSAVAAYNFAGETGGFTSHDSRGRFLAELGFQPVPQIDQLGKGNFYAALSPEDLSALDADLLVWVSSFNSVPDLVALPMRKILKAHREGREVFAGETIAAALSFGSILSLPFALAELEDGIALALDGDPKTAVPSSVAAGIAP